MACDICLFFDNDTETRIRRFWSILRTRGISSPLLRSGGKPHLTLAIWEELDTDLILKDLMDFAGSHSAFPVTFSSIATFGVESGAVFLGPVITPWLISVHSRIYRTFNDLCESSEGLYRPECWVPHCSLVLGLDPSAVAGALDTCLEIVHLPIRGWVKEIGILTFEKDSVGSQRSYRLNSPGSS